jgi:hypothetical protein
MLKGAQASANATTQMVDLMTFVDGRLKALRPPSTMGADEAAGVSSGA